MRRYYRGLTALGLLLGLAVFLPSTAQAADAGDKSKQKSEKKDSFDKAGGATKGALETAGDAAETGLDATGKGVGAAVEHTGRGVTKAAKATGNAMAETGEAIAGFFGADGKPDRDKIREAQRALQAKGYYGGPIDGIIGPRTRSGVREFQRDENLEVTGKFDDSTKERLGVN